ncbi:type II toxin-antitoxin system toxin ribonuclease C26 [soil metagenome]
MIADTSGLLALFNRREPTHESVAAVVEQLDQPMIVSPYVVAEVDYLVATRMGVDAELSVLKELSSGAYHLAPIAADELTAARRVIKKYSDQEIGVTDASIVVLADRHRTKSVLTLDPRHFDVLRPLSGGRFTIRP